MNHRATHADHFGATDYVEFEALKSEWEQFKFVTQDLKTECPMTITPQPGNTPTEWLLTMLCSIPSFKVMFPNLVRLSAVACLARKRRKCIEEDKDEASKFIKRQHV